MTRADNTSFTHRYLNSGNFLLRHNRRTRAMMDMWRAGYEFQVGGARQEGSSCSGVRWATSYLAPCRTR